MVIRFRWYQCDPVTVNLPSAFYLVVLAVTGNQGLLQTHHLIHKVKNRDLQVSNISAFTSWYFFSILRCEQLLSKYYYRIRDLLAFWKEKNKTKKRLKKCEMNKWIKNTKCFITTYFLYLSIKVFRASYLLLQIKIHAG